MDKVYNDTMEDEVESISFSARPRVGEGTTLVTLYIEDILKKETYMADTMQDGQEMEEELY